MKTWRLNNLLAIGLLLLAMVLAGPMLARAAAPAGGVSLLRPDTLVGWEHGAPPSGWRIAKGVLEGTDKSSALLSGWTMGDFELSFRWAVARQGTLVVDLVDVPAGAGLAVSLTAGDKPISVSDRGTSLFSGGKLQPAADTWHSARLVRSGATLTVEVDGQQAATVAIAAERRFGLGLAIPRGEAGITELRMNEPAGGSIFDGRDLTGWWSPTGLQSWRAIDGVLECLNKDGNYLRTEKEFGNFTLSLEYKQAPHCNSGIGIRTPRNGWPSGDGMELQLQDEPGLDKHATMAIYGNIEPIARADHGGAWNKAVIKADGRMISAWVNSELVQQANTFWHPELAHRHLKGWIGFQDHGGQIEFRDIRVLEAADGAGLDAWYAPRTLSGPEQLFQRLINPSALSLPDGLVTAAAQHRSTTGDEQTIAELTGPGAVIQVWRSKPSGHISFFFDGAKQPAVDCLANLLAEHTPHMTEERDPVLTCLPFARSVRVTLRDAPGADYRIEYVKFPAGTPVATYVPGQPVLPRGWLSAMEYREHQYGWGTHREEDPAPRHAGDVEHLEPGATAPLVKLEGAGILQWIKLQTSAELVQNDDLWLEVRLDGQEAPALAAPARFYFASLTDSVPLVGGTTNHYNFVNVFRGGFTSMLAMPFGKGAQIAVRNTGKSTLGKIAVSTSVLRDEESTPATRQWNPAARLRLRGKFLTGGDSHELISLSGAGRLVGMVWAPTEKAPGGLAALNVDGAQQADWTQLGLDAFLGGWPGEKSFFRALSGRHDGLAWRYLVLAPIDFRQSLVLTSTGPTCDRLVLWYER